MKIKSIKTYENQKETTMVFKFTVGNDRDGACWSRSVVIRPCATAEEVGHMMIAVGREILNDDWMMGMKKPNAK